MAQGRVGGHRGALVQAALVPGHGGVVVKRRAWAGNSNSELWRISQPEDKNLIIMVRGKCNLTAYFCELKWSKIEGYVLNHFLFAV